MAVEVAIGAFGDAERPVDVEGQRSSSVIRCQGWYPWARAWNRVGAGQRSPRPRCEWDGSSFTDKRRHQLAEGVRAVADRVLLGRVHLAEGLLVAGGDEDRIVAEAVRRRAAARRGCRRPGLRTIRCGRRASRARARRRNGRCGWRRGRAPPARPGPARIARLKSRSPLTSPGPASGDTLGSASAQRAEKMPGRSPSASTHRPLSSASAGRPERSAAARALRSALSMKVVPISSGSGRSSSAAETGSIP